MKVEEKETKINTVDTEKFEEVIKYINENFTENITRKSISKTTGFSPDHFARHFKTYTGKTIRDYVNEVRVKTALELLSNSNTKVIDVAYNVGFESLRSFNRVFFRIIGDTPSNFRRTDTKFRNSKSA